MIAVDKTNTGYQACAAQACGWTDGPLKMLIVAGAVRFGANQSNQQDASKMIQVGSEL